MMAQMFNLINDIDDCIEKYNFKKDDENFDIKSKEENKSLQEV